VRCVFLVLGWLLLASPVASEIYSWVDEDGVTHLTDDPAAVPPSQRPGEGRGALGGLWEDVRGPISEERRHPPPQTREEARQRRVLRGVVGDLERGENARAYAALMSVLRGDPANPEAHWYLALLDRQRGRYEAAQVHLEAFLSAAGDDLEPWRASARRRLEELADERRLADTRGAQIGGPWVGLSNEHFRVYYDPALGEASPDYARTVMRYLAEARASVGERLGAVPREAMGVVFYGKGAYLEAYRHRFSFQTVGFFDGRIHVVSAGHPAGELRALLFHEYAHAVYREQTGGDQPYWLNEGLAEISERSSLNRRGLTRSERQALRRRIDAGAQLLGPRRRRCARGLSRIDGGGRVDRGADRPRSARAASRPAGRGGGG
jgi:tetratricopeptide (TPR) repeat protein